MGIIAVGARETLVSTTAGSGVEVLVIDTPSLGDRSYLATTGTSPWSSTRSGTSTGCWPWPRPAGSHHPRVRDPHPQRLRDRRPGAGPRDRRGLPRERAPTRWRSTGSRSPTATWSTVGPVDAGAGASPRPGTRSLTCHTRWRTRPPARRSRCSPAARCCTGRPAAPTCSAPSTRPRSPRRSTPRPAGWPRSCRTRPRSTPRTGSAASAPPPCPRRTAPPSAEERRVNPALTLDEDPTSRTCWPALTPTRPTTRRWPRPTRPARPRPT